MRLPVVSSLTPLLAMLAALTLPAGHVRGQNAGGNEVLFSHYEAEPVPEALNLIDSLPTRKPIGLRRQAPSEAEPLMDGPLADEPVDGGVFSPLHGWLAGEVIGPDRTASSGFWLRDGLSYFEADVVLLHRRQKENIKLAIDNSVGSDRELRVHRGQLGLAANARMTIGQYLFRDAANRDHAVEFSFYGFGDWSGEGDVAAATDNFLTSQIDPFIGGFNGSDVQTFRYAADLDSYEVNYRVFRRLGRDQMILKPDGQWVRQATAGSLLSLLVGLRVVQVDELFNYTSVSTLPNIRRGSLAIRTNNDLVGFQLGAEWMQQHANWNWGVRGKAGAYVNFTSMSSSLLTIDPVLLEQDRHDRAEEDVLAFVGELGVFARYHLRPNFSVRVAYEALWLNQVAVAPEQIDFSPTPIRNVVTGGSPYYMGFSAGWELVW